MKPSAQWSVRESVWLGLPILLSMVAVGCGRKRAADPTVRSESTCGQTLPPWLRDVTHACGLHFAHDTGPAGRYRMPEIMGSGAALFDYDQDGRLDVYIVQNGGPEGPRNQLFHQEPDGTFKNVSAGSGLDVAGWGMGVAVADVNNDGLPDVLVTEYGRLRLLLNHGDGTFQDATREAGLEEEPGVEAGDSAVPRHWYTSAAFFDYDRDGWLDLVVAEYVAYDPSRVCKSDGNRPDYCGPSLFPGMVARLFHNRGPVEPGDGAAAPAKGERVVPHFQLVSAAAGLADVPGPGLGVICRDFDGDGWPDVFVANDGSPNRLWINQHDGTFREDAWRLGVAAGAMGQVQGSMGIAAGDLLGEGRPSLFVTHLTQESNSLYVPGSNGAFSDEASARGLTGPGRGATGFGTVMEDFTNSGRLDLAVANGRVVRAATLAVATPGLPVYWQQYAERNALYANDGAGHFRDISPANPDFGATPNVGRSLAHGDIDNDGGVDLLLTRAGGEAALLRDVAPRRGHWLTVRAIDPALGGRDCIGAVVIVEAAGRRQMGWVDTGGSYLCASDPRVHFGLGAADRVDRLEVVWPDGARQRFAVSAVDQILTLPRKKQR